MAGLRRQLHEERAAASAKTGPEAKTDEALRVPSIHDEEPDNEVIASSGMNGRTTRTLSFTYLFFCPWRKHVHKTFGLISQISEPIGFQVEVKSKRSWNNLLSSVLPPIAPLLAAAAREDPVVDVPVASSTVVNRVLQQKFLLFQMMEVQFIGLNKGTVARRPVVAIAAVVASHSVVAEPLLVTRWTKLKLLSMEEHSQMIRMDGHDVRDSFAQTFAKVFCFYLFRHISLCSYCSRVCPCSLERFCTTAEFVSLEGGFLYRVVNG